MTTATTKTSPSHRQAADLRFAPAYTIREVAHYMLMPVATLRSWTLGRHYTISSGERRLFKPVIEMADRKRGLLSFVNLVEIHVLDAVRRVHKVNLRKVREALNFLGRQYGTPHPLVEHAMLTDGKDLFVQKYGSLVQISRDGQLAMGEVMDAYLERIACDGAGMAERLYPFTLKRPGMVADELRSVPRSIVIDPSISFGRPVITGTGIPTAIIAERYKAGDSIASLAKDYAQDKAKIEDALRCELRADAA